MSTRNTLMLEEAFNSKVGHPSINVTFKEVHRAKVKLGRGFRAEANYYTREEDQKILGYILEGHYSRHVKGRALWSMMEKACLLPGRTWQSMKERFLKIIMRRLHSFSCLGEEEREQLKSAAAPGKKRNPPAKNLQSEARSKIFNNNVTTVFPLQAITSNYQQSLKLHLSGQKQKDGVQTEQELENMDNQLTEKKKMISKDLHEYSSIGETDRDGEYYEEDCRKLEPGLEELDVKAGIKSEIEENDVNHRGHGNSDELDITINMEARRQALGLRRVLVVGKELALIRDMPTMKEQMINKKLNVRRGLVVRKYLAVRLELVKKVRKKQLVILQDHYEESGKQDQLAFMEKLGLCSLSEATVRREELEEAMERRSKRTTRSQAKNREQYVKRN